MAQPLRLPRPHSWGRLVRDPQNVSAGVRRRQTERLRHSVFAHTSVLLAVTTLLTGIAATPPCAFGQLLRFGVVGGTNLTRDFHTTNDNYLIPATDQPAYRMNALFYSKSHSPILGPMMEVSLPRNFSVEVDGLDEPLHAVQYDYGLDEPNYRFGFTVLTWQFPVLAKYRLSASRFAPFVEGGPSWREAGNNPARSEFLTRASPTPVPARSSWPPRPA